jgi:hypothetical protein
MAYSAEPGVAGARRAVHSDIEIKELKREWEKAESVKLRNHVSGRCISLGEDVARGQEGHARIAIAATSRNSFSVAPLTA